MAGSGRERAVVDFVGIDGHVQPRALEHELELRQCRCAAVPAERGEVGVQCSVRVTVRAPVRIPLRAIAGGIAGEHRRDIGVADLRRVARDDARPPPAARRQRCEADDVVLDDHVRLELTDDLVQPVVDELRAVDECLERRRDEARELLDRRLPEHRRGVADEVLPELAGDLFLEGRRGEPHELLLEALRLERPCERLLDDEDDAVAAATENVADSDAVVGRAVRAFGEERNRRHPRDPTKKETSGPVLPRRERLRAHEVTADRSSWQGGPCRCPHRSPQRAKTRAARARFARARTARRSACGRPW